MTTPQEVDRRLTVVETRFENLATKSDLAAMDSRIDTFATKTKSDFAALESRMDTFATKSDFAALESRMDTFATKTDLAELETRLVKWMIGVLIGATVAASSVAVLVQSLIS